MKAPHANRSKRWIAGGLAAAFVALAFGVLPALAAKPTELADLWSPGWMERDMWSQDMTPEMRARMQRHMTFMNGDVPESYQGIKSTVEATPASIATGRTLFMEHCERCHGPDGLGRGVGAMGLSPSPALLAYLIQQPMAIDSFLLWSISEGGAQFGTSMPAFKDDLKRKEIWHIINFMRAGFPPGPVQQ